MSPARLFQRCLLRLLPLLVLGTLALRAMAQADPPSRVARLNQAEGTVVFSQAGDNEWVDAQRNRPLTRGDRVWADRGSRADIQVGSSAVRMDGQTHLEILVLDDQAAQLSVTQGSVYLRIRSLPEGENFEVDTPNLAWRAAYPGDFRIDVDPVRGTTRVTIHSGTGSVYGEGGQVLPMGGGQQITFRARTLAQVAAQESPPQDTFDRWAAERNRREDQSVSARHVPREVVGYQQLDGHGQWAQDASHGAVWFPQGMPADWAPYRNGHWEWIAPWGWTWLDDAPWGFAPFHYGRWALIGARWAWVPGRLGLKPVYAPALVAFVGPGSGNIGAMLGVGRSSVTWFPLAPGEVWQPPYRASPVYMSNLNQNLKLDGERGHANLRRTEALTSVASEEFHRGRPQRAGWLRVAANALASAEIVPPPPRPQQLAAERTRTPVAKAAPPAQVTASAAKAVADATAAPETGAQQKAEIQRMLKAVQEQRAKAQQPAPGAQQAAEQPRADQQAVREAQARAAEQVRQEQQAQRAQARREQLAARQAEQAQQEQMAQRAQARREQVAAKQAEQARREQAAAKQAEQARREQVAARQAEQTRREQTARRAQQARHEQASKQEQAGREQARQQAARQAEQTRRAQLAKRAEQARREAIAERAEQARRDAIAKRTEQARREALAKRAEQRQREAHAQNVEQARRSAERDAQALRAARAQREEQQAQQARREAQEREREQAQQRAAAAEAAEIQQQQQRLRSGRPDLRDDRRSRGLPIINFGPMS